MALIYMPIDIGIVNQIIIANQIAGSGSQFMDLFNWIFGQNEA
jgi:hypothetical protein